MGEQEQKALLINTTVHNRRQLQCFARGALGWQQYLSLAFLGVLILLDISGQIINGIFEPSLFFLAGVILFISISIFYAFLNGYSFARRNEKRNGELYPGAVASETWTFYEDYVVRCSNLTMENFQIDYSRFIRIKETKHQILLFRQQSIVHFLDKEGFEQGDAATLILFLKVKCPSAKFRLRK